MVSTGALIYRSLPDPKQTSTNLSMSWKHRHSCAVVPSSCQPSQTTMLDACIDYIRTVKFIEQCSVVTFYPWVKSRAGGLDVGHLIEVNIFQNKSLNRMPHRTHKEAKRQSNFPPLPSRWPVIYPSSLTAVHLCVLKREKWRLSIRVQVHDPFECTRALTNE